MLKFLEEDDDSPLNKIWYLIHPDSREDIFVFLSNYDVNQKWISMEDTRQKHSDTVKNYNKILL